MSCCIALLRGINVGRAKRVSMAALKDLFSELGHSEVRTLLNSGNVLFETPRPDVRKLSAAIQASIVARCGFSATVAVITAAQLSRIIEENPLLAVAKDPARHLVGFATDPAALARLKPLLDQKWKPDVFAVTSRAAYLWCCSGILDSPLVKTFAREGGDTLTTRNWATVLKLQAAVRGLPAA